MRRQTVYEIVLCSAWGWAMLSLPMMAPAEEPGIVRIRTAPATAEHSTASEAVIRAQNGASPRMMVVRHARSISARDAAVSTADECPCWDNTGSAMINYLRCKFGFLIPTGNGGAGTPPFGWYTRIYPQDPYYFDQRDGQAWGAAGIGTPVAVPLAPVVGHQYNYSWGTPSSRLTPLSRVAPY
ncbi:MAG: hypothetical protein KatS3mg113_1083 [Planctomycetaceae bacterium]|nr:MAG: hypothetical protein KatS3mg113_1083 [Planctomycetaceae bacterium]